ncbi:efflux RND transporter permease subunit [Microbulbifer litoralis]|uniref:efflux RND transporter permease subunit n=1 Tax=Microbulbifer litoralis TaxID=2933965 RepID=UPI002028D2AD|nr:MMPL family transporter [Microbulbifer sp. GX H0434]
MKWYFKAIIDWPRTTLLGLLIATVLLGLGLPKLEIRNNSDSELPESDPIVATKERIDEIFGDKSAILIGIETDNIYNTDTLQKVADLSLELEKVDYVIPNEITSLSTVNNVVGTDEGLAIGTLMKEVPATPEEIAALQRKVDGNDMIRGALVSDDHRFTAIVANLKDGADQATVYRQVYDLIRKYEGPETLYASGEKIFSEEIDSGVQADSNLLTPLSLLMIMAVLYFFLRSPRGVALPWLSIVISIVWTLGFMGHIGLKQSVVSSMLPALLVIIGSSFSIHIMLHYYAATRDNGSLSPKQAAFSAVEHLGRPLFLAGITSSLGAMSLVVFNVLSIREFGIIFSVAILFSLFLCATVIPSLLAMLKIQVRDTDNLRGTRWLTGVLQRMTWLSLNRPLLVLTAFALVATLSVFGIQRIETGLDVASIFPDGHRGKVSLDKFGDNLGGVRVLSVMVEAPESGGIKSPEYLRKIAEFEAFMKEQPGVGHATSFSDVVMQVAKSLNPEWGGVGRIPDTRNEIAQYLFLYDISGTPGDFANLVDYDYRRARIQVTLNTSDPDDHARLYRQARDFWSANLPQGANVEFGGDTLFWIAQSEYVVKGKVLNIILSVCIIIFFVSLIYRAISAGFIAVLPVVMGGLVTFGVMGFAGIRLDIAAACISGVMAGIGIDFSLHYLDRLRVHRRENNSDIPEACHKTQMLVGRSIIYDAITNAVGFFVVTASGFVVVKNFGYLLAISMMATSISVVLLVPVLLLLTKPRFASRGTAGETTEPGIAPERTETAMAPQ